jgi:hypothetical protein
METRMVINIPVFDPISRNWFISFLETKKLGSPSVFKLQDALVAFEVFIGIDSFTF